MKKLIIGFFLISNFIYSQEIKPVQEGEFTVYRNPEKSEIDEGNIKRIEEDLGVSWSGVKKCGKRANQEIDAQAKNWVKNKMFEYQLHYWRAYGWNRPKAHISTRKEDVTSNKNSCFGSVKVRVFFEVEM